MGSSKLQGVRIAILVSDGFEELELLEPRQAFDRDGAATFVVSPAKNKVVGMNQEHGKKEVPVDIPLQTARPEDFHALFLPGGGRNVEHLAKNSKAVQFAEDFVVASKPVAAIGEGIAVLIPGGTLRNRKVTCPVFLQEALRKEGAGSVDQDVVCDSTLITARGLEDISAFTHAVTRILADLRSHSSEMRRSA
ncbi:MAG TPA: DJ-1/PfpI family protein [Verrucomicrobiae bacterium]|jgi:protease I|nr:DJ-1/PfpI family protein [Verrucomicrobiae bacterium]